MYIEPMVVMLRRGRLTWSGHVERRDDDWLKKCTEMELGGVRPVGGPRRNGEDKYKLNSWNWLDMPLEKAMRRH